jgi:hypothetical protein
MNLAEQAAKLPLEAALAEAHSGNTSSFNEGQPTS